MTQDHKVMLRRAETPVSQRLGVRTATELPDELVADQANRLALFSMIGGALWVYALATDLIVPFVLPGTMSPAVVRAIHYAAIATAIAMYLYVRYSSNAPHTKRSVGLVYFLFNCASVAALNAIGHNGWTMPVNELPTFHISWNTVAILVFSMIASAPPRQLLVATLLAAATDPLGVWIAHLRGVQVPPLAYIALLYLPNFVCAVVGLTPSVMLHRLGSRLRHAQELGSYRLLEQLGHGGMGEVWRAEHRLLARTAAIKLIRPDLLGASNRDESRRMIRRFEREARATASLHSPHTIQVFDFGTTGDGSFYYVMELLAGRDLESLVRDFGPLPANRTITLMRQVCHSLADAHARGLVHRDIKPANIYTCRMGLEYDFVKVLDFGLVKTPERAGRQQTMLTAAQGTAGTPAYMAPEVILGEEVDRRADVYAVGCVAYFLLTGQLVFEAENSMKMMMRHINEIPLPPSQRSELPIPADLNALVMSCLAKDPNDRPQNAEELFRMANHCTACEGWNQESAKAWWMTHMPELCGPLTLGSVDTEFAQQRL